MYFLKVYTPEGREGLVSCEDREILADFKEGLTLMGEGYTATRLDYEPENYLILDEQFRSVCDDVYDFASEAVENMEDN